MKDFIIEGSNDDSTWVQLHSGTLEDPQLFGPCDNPLETFTVQDLTYQYIRLTALNYYRSLPALQYFATDFLTGICHAHHVLSIISLRRVMTKAVPQASIMPNLEEASALIPMYIVAICVISGDTTTQNFKYS